MGVPKLYRFISDRYPAINKTVKEHEIPQYENLYLDMNSIIHTCSHPSDSDIHFRIGKKEFSDEDIYQNVSRYVEIIFSIVKPILRMYLAFDGVAPRAKMNQQRGHRFRAAKDLNDAVVNNELLDDAELFDTNCITTGTVFMIELIDHIKHFIAYKISTDPAWQKCKIIVSGPEVPGEGEHKIMEYMRYIRAQPQYNPNTRHCLYCLDADLIILGLCTHEPHFSLIREKVTFGKKMNMITPEESDFELLHLSLLREYLEYEFSPVKSTLKFPFNLERIIDDWVLIGFLVGNDFIPQLPNLNIVHGALPLLYKVYMEVLPTMDGYMNECGELNIARFQTYLHRLSKFETNLSKPCKVPEFLANESGSESNNSQDEPKLDVPDDIPRSVDNDLERRKQMIENAFKMFSLKSTNKDEKESESNEKPSVITGNISKNNEKVLVENSDSKPCTSALSMPCMEEYYKNKLKFDKIERKQISTLVEDYMKAIQWTLRYYYQGCCSWSWYYPYHYAPLISDFKELQDIKFDFTMGTPFLPLQHLLAVLPPANAHLLPKQLQSLLTSANSPIIGFYPKNFEVDINGKTNDWESIVLIPFIDEQKLIKAMQPHMKKLNFKDRKRNTNGSMCVFGHTKTSLGQYPVETIFGSFINYAELKHVNAEVVYLPKNQLVQGLCRNVSVNLTFPGFPTLKHITHSFKSAQSESKFNTHRPTKIERMILHVSPKPDIKLEDLAKKFLGKKVYAFWPYIQEVFVIGVTDFKVKIILKNFWKGYSEDNVKIDELQHSAIKNQRDDDKLTTEMYKNLLGIEIGKTRLSFYVFPKIGQKYECGNDGKLHPQIKWNPKSISFPYQLIVKDENVQCCNNMPLKNMNDVFKHSSTCFMTCPPNYGAKGKIQNIDKKQFISVLLELSEEPNFSSNNKDFFIADTSYMNSNEIAKRLKISTTLLSRITGALIVTEEPITTKHHDIGLRIRFPKHEKELFGYTKKHDSGWLYSDKAFELIRNYISEFPYLFENLNKHLKDGSYFAFTVSDLFPDGLTQLNNVKVWLAQQKVHYTTYLECHTQTLGLNGVVKLEKYISEFHSKENKQLTTRVQVKPQSLFIPGTLTGLVPPDIKAEYKLLDRIVCVKNNFTVPLGSKGTIIGIQQKEEKCKDVYEILFDFPFTGGLTLYESSEHTCYRLLGTDFINISYGQRGVQNARRTGPDTLTKTPKNIQNKTNSTNQQSATNLNGKDFKSAKTTSKGGFQQQQNNHWKKDQNSTKNTHKSNDGNTKQQNNPDLKIANNDPTRNMKVYPKQQSKSKIIEANMPSSHGNDLQEADNDREKSNGISKNIPEGISTGTRPKKPFVKKNMQKAENVDNRNEKSVRVPSFNNKNRTHPKDPSNKKNWSKSQGRTNSNKNTPSEVNESKNEKQCTPSNVLHNSDIDKKSCD